MSDPGSLRAVIDAAFERRAELGPGNVPPDLESALEECLTLLDSGEARVAEPGAGGWVVNEWLKKAVLLSFRTRENVAMDGGFTRFYDKMPLKYALATEEQLRAGGARIVGGRWGIVEGVVVEAGSVISMGVFIGQSTRIYERATGSILQGRVPAGSVVVAGTLPSADGRYSLYCAVIVKRVDAKTRAKTSINELLRSAVG